MKRIDAHQHFWKFRKPLNPPIASNIQRDFLPVDVSPLLHRNGFDGCVAVQATQSEKETDFLIALSKQHNFIKGVVGWVDLQANDIDERLEWYKWFTILKGFRHILQHEPQRDQMLHHSFLRGIAALQYHGFTYDILVFPDQLKFACKLAAMFPEQKFVIDHIGKPSIRQKEIARWKTDIEQIARHTNVYCKISGMVTEADWINWRKEDFRPYIDVIVNAFGIERVMFGSDWPTCQVAARFEQVIGIVKYYFSNFTIQEQELFFGGNAIRFYNL